MEQQHEHQKEKDAFFQRSGKKYPDLELPNWMRARKRRAEEKEDRQVLVLQE